jgi:hypothetical protein
LELEYPLEEVLWPILSGTSLAEEDHWTPPILLETLMLEEGEIPLMVDFLTSF